MRMGHEVGGQMTMTAHRALFTLKDPRAQRALARTAANEGWKSKRVEGGGAIDDPADQE